MYWVHGSVERLLAPRSGPWPLGLLYNLDRDKHYGQVYMMLTRPWLGWFLLGLTACGSPNCPLPTDRYEASQRLGECSVQSDECVLPTGDTGCFVCFSDADLLAGDEPGLYCEDCQAISSWVSDRVSENRAMINGGSEFLNGDELLCFYTK